MGHHKSKSPNHRRFNHSPPHHSSILPEDEYPVIKKLHEVYDGINPVSNNYLGERPALGSEVARHLSFLRRKES